MIRLNGVNKFEVMEEINIMDIIRVLLPVILISMLAVATINIAKKNLKVIIMMKDKKIICLKVWLLACVRNGSGYSIRHRKYSNWYVHRYAF